MIGFSWLSFVFGLFYGRAKRGFRKRIGFP